MVLEENREWTPMEQPDGMVHPQFNPLSKNRLGISSSRHQAAGMKIEGIVGCYERTSGMFYFARMCSKIRLHAAGQLPEDYFDMLGHGFDPAATSASPMKT